MAKQVWLKLSRRNLHRVVSGAMQHPRTIEEIYEDYSTRKRGLRLALTDEQEDFFRQCDPDKENLCLYGEPDGRWTVDLPAEEVPPELPEPCLGINFARDGMARKDWLALVAVHSDAWLLSVAMYYGAKLDGQGRLKLFRLINQDPTLYEVVTGKHLKGMQQRPGIQPAPGPAGAAGIKRKAGEGYEAPYGGAELGPTGLRVSGASAPMPQGRLLTHADISLNLRGRRAEMFWPDDRMWYMVEIHAVNPRSRQAKIQYSSGEFEELNLEEIIREGHMSLID